MDQICFSKGTFSMFSFILLAMGCYLVYFTYKQYESENMTRNEKILKLESKLDQEMFKIKTESKTQATNKIGIEDQNRFLRVVYDPLKSPEQIYPGGSFSERGFDSTNQNQMVGYISNVSGQYPLYARSHDNRNDRFEYYTINEGRNKIKIPISTKNFNQLYDGDSVNVPDFSTTPFIFKEYQTEGNRYNPRVF
jgi:hypothetical protein